MKPMLVGEDPMTYATDNLNIVALRYVMTNNQSLHGGSASFYLRATVPDSLSNDLMTTTQPLDDSISEVDDGSACREAHVVNFIRNPYTYGKKSAQATQAVSSLSVLDCNGNELNIENLAEDQLINIDLVRGQPEVGQNKRIFCMVFFIAHRLVLVTQMLVW